MRKSVFETDEKKSDRLRAALSDEPREDKKAEVIELEARRAYYRSYRSRRRAEGKDI